MIKKPTVTFLIGLPGSGKSTWCKFANSKSRIASSDDYIEEVAKAQGKTYNEIFQPHMAEAYARVYSIITQAIEDHADLIIDQTNLTEKKRAQVLDLIPAHYERRAIIFTPRSWHEWRERLNNRPGKIIPEEVLIKMEKSYEPPQPRDFHSIVEYYT